jgi:glycosidase
MSRDLERKLDSYVKVFMAAQESHLEMAVRKGWKIKPHQSAFDPVGAVVDERGEFTRFHGPMEARFVLARSLMRTLRGVAFIYVCEGRRASIVDPEEAKRIREIAGGDYHKAHREAEPHFKNAIIGQWGMRDARRIMSREFSVKGGIVEFGDLEINDPGGKFYDPWEIVFT